MNLTFFDLALVGALASRLQALDTLETYPVANALAVLNGGSGWAGAWVFNPGAVKTQVLDSFEDYAAEADVAGLVSGFGFAGPFVAGISYYRIIKASDTLESYAAGVALNGLNSGTGFVAGFIAR